MLMKKFFLLTALMVGTLMAHAANYAYLTFETTDGAKVSVDVSSLTITISGTTLTAGSQSFTLSDLNKMYFSNINETASISTVNAELLNESSEIYDLNGLKMQKDQMCGGQVYIVKTKSGIYKIVMK